nr:hypothetical protein CFP56_75649 [Quercus suber]
MSVVSPIYFIGQQQTLSSEKAYQLKFDPLDGFPPSNIESDEYPQKIDDIRGNLDQFSVERNGFAIIPIQERLSYADYGDETKIRQIYLPQVAEAIKELLGAARVQIFEHVVSTPSSRSSINIGHDDVTPAWAAALAEHMNKMKGDDLPSERLKFIKCIPPDVCVTT